jgi:hypothetical protein
MARQAQQSQLGALLNTLQSAEFYLIAAAEPLGENFSWAAVCAAETWKAACRLRLLLLQDPGCLLRSEACADGSGAPEDWESVLRRVGPPGTPRLPGPCAPCSPPFTRERPLIHSYSEPAAARLLQLGEALHILQPVVHLLALSLTRKHAGGRSRAPWLVALLLEATSCVLCERGRGSEREIPWADHTSNDRELRHRHRLLFLLLLRPALRSFVCAALRSLSRGLNALSPMLSRVLRDAATLVERVDATNPRLLTSMN